MRFLGRSRAWRPGPLRRGREPDLAERRRVAGGVLGALAIIEALGLLQMLEGFAELRLGVVELGEQVLGRLAEIVAPLGGGGA